MVKDVFKKSVLGAGEVLTSPYRLTERFLRLIHSHDEFQPFIDKGLVDTILAVEKKKEEMVFEMPQTVSWERVSNKLPRIFYDLVEVVENEKKRFS